MTRGIDQLIRHTVALRPYQLLSLAEAFNVSVDDLVDTNGRKKRGTGPTGRMKQLFEAASQFPGSSTVAGFCGSHATGVWVDRLKNHRSNTNCSTDP